MALAILTVWHSWKCGHTIYALIDEIEMEFEFSPAFEPLIKITKGLPKVPISEDEIVAMSNYLGVDLPDTSFEDRVTLLSDALSAQNGFLSTHLSSNAIYDSDEYRTSAFIREIVANNRMSLRNRHLRNG